MECTRVLSPTDINYKIICAGSGFDIGQGRPVNVSFEGRRYQAKMHSKTKGRIDGLSQLYADFAFTEGQELSLSYDEGTNTIEISDPWAMPFDDPDTEAGDENAQDAGAGAAGEKVYSQTEIYHIVSDFDSVAKHQEYYGRSDFLRVAVNRGWIVYGGGNWGDGYWLMNEDTLEKIPLNVLGHQYDTFLGANCAGLWFMDYGSGRNKWGDAVPGKLIYTGPSFSGETVWRFNGRKATVKELYIHVLNVYYIAHISENKQALIEVCGNGDERELFVAHKGESLDSLSVNDDFVVFRLWSQNAPEKSGWYVWRRVGESLVFLNRARRADSPWPAIEIRRIFLDQKVMWTEVTEKEAAQYGIDPQDWICRSLGEPKEGKFGVYKDTRKPVTWRGISRCAINYFDGKVAYSASSYSQLKRISRDGSEIMLYSGGHGECEKFVVSDKYLYGNFDALVPVRVPKLFRQPENTSAVASLDIETGGMKDLVNPEAEAIWGTKDIRF